MTLILRTANSETDISAAKTLFYEYADWLGVDLCFQGFDTEMKLFPGTYEAVYVALMDGDVIGTIALKHHSNERCEMKRLYVKPSAQGHGAGKALCDLLLKDAARRGYKEMVLDTLKRLETAVNLYRKLGFQDFKAYTENPEEDVVYMIKSL